MTKRKVQRRTRRMVGMPMMMPNKNLRGTGFKNWARDVWNWTKNNKILSSSLGAAGGIGLSSGNPYGVAAGIGLSAAGSLAGYLGAGKQPRYRMGRGHMVMNPVYGLKY